MFYMQLADPGHTTLVLAVSQSIVCPKGALQLSLCIGRGAEAAAWDDSTVLLSRLADSRCVPRRTPWQKATAIGRPSAAAIYKGARQ